MGHICDVAEKDYIYKKSNWELVFRRTAENMGYTKIFNDRTIRKDDKFVRSERQLSNDDKIKESSNYDLDRKITNNFANGSSSITTD